MPRRDWAEATLFIFPHFKFKVFFNKFLSSVFWRLLLLCQAGNETSKVCRCHLFYSSKKLSTYRFADAPWENPPKEFLCKSSVKITYHNCLVKKGKGKVKSQLIFSRFSVRISKMLVFYTLFVLFSELDIKNVVKRMCWIVLTLLARQTILVPKTLLRAPLQVFFGRSRDPKDVAESWDTFLPFLCAQETDQPAPCSEAKSRDRSH